MTFSHIHFIDAFKLALAFVLAFILLQGIVVLKGVLLIFLTSVIITLATEKLIFKLETYNIPRLASASLIYLFGLLMIVFMFYTIVPPLATEIKNLLIEYPVYSEQISDDVTLRNDLLNYIRSLSVNFTDSPQAMISFLISTFGSLTSFLAVFFVSFFFTIQKDGIGAFVYPWVPVKKLNMAKLFLWRVREKVGGWLWGKVISSVIVGVITFIGLTIVDIPYALSLGTLALVLNFIPFIGPTIAAIPAVALGVSISLPLGLLIGLFYFVINGVIEAFVLNPIFMRHAIEVNPALLILFIISGAHLGGVLGVIISIPLSAILYLIWTEYFRARETKSNLTTKSEIGI